MRQNRCHGRSLSRLSRKGNYYQFLTNAHRRRVLLKVNARELYHISRLRQDPTAQWDIRQSVGRMAELASKVMPLSFLLLGGKEDYPAIYKGVFRKEPKCFPPRYLK